jgi:Na+-transporting methylmalonyl-CoA/oxaloacetate decarboxylase gamma subunit
MSTIWNNIVENEGFEIAGVGILLVFSILLFVSLVIGMLPKILRPLQAVLDPKPSLKIEEPVDSAPQNRARAAAAAAALHHHLTSTER